MVAEVPGQEEIAQGFPGESTEEELTEEESTEEKKTN